MHALCMLLPHISCEEASNDVESIETRLICSPKTAPVLVLHTEPRCCYDSLKMEQ